MAGHTPGPWSAQLHHERRDGGRFSVFVTGNNHLVPIAAVPTGVEGFGREEGRANACLIAAAPKLLEELAKFAAKANGYDGVPPPKYFGDIDCELHYPDSLKIEFTLGELRAARKAIAAATGEAK